MKLPIVVLAGGLATRLRPITEKIPKSLIAVNKVPFILHQLSLFQRNRINRVHFCLGHLGEMVQKVIEDSVFPSKMDITYSYDGKKLLGTGGAINVALELLPDSFFVTYGDSYLNIDYQNIEDLFLSLEKKNSGLMTVYKNSSNYDTSNVVYKNKRILLYSKKQVLDNMEYIDYGIGILRKEHFDGFHKETLFDLSEIYEKLAQDGSLIGYESMERFYEIGSISGINDLSRHLNSKHW